MKLKALALAAMTGALALPLSALADTAKRPVCGDFRSGNRGCALEYHHEIVVNVSSKDTADAKKQADDHVAQYFDFLQKNGIEKKDIDAANLST